MRWLIMFGVGTIFVLGYTAGEQQVLTEDVTLQDQTQEVVQVVSKWKFPAICQDTIVHGMQTTWADKGKINEYHGLARKCFETVEMEVPDVMYDLPAPAVYVIPNEDNDEDLDAKDAQLIENAFLDCVDDNFDILNDEVENYCDENYEDYLE